MRWFWQRHLTMAAVLSWASACADYPRDQEDTLKRIRDTDTIVVGMTTLGAQDKARAERFLTRLGAAAKARPEIHLVPLEAGLAQLERGELDLVVGEFADDSPWLADVAVIEPLTTRLTGERKTGLAPAVANGENAFVAMVEQAVRDDNAATRQ